VTNQVAIERLQNRDEFLQGKILDLISEQRPTYWLERDRESIALAIAAIRYVIAVEQYEAAQPLDSRGQNLAV